MNTNTKATRLSPEYELGQCEILCLHLADLLSHVLLLSCPTGIEVGRARVEDCRRDHEEHEHPCPNKLAEQHGFPSGARSQRESKTQNRLLFVCGSLSRTVKVGLQARTMMRNGLADDKHLPNEATPLNAWGPTWFTLADNIHDMAMAFETRGVR